mmetsp:Transcript_70495/g.210190  ORF Transcript_70495/g.210190 Transcript_70495/m.210190 type:complete len:206 (+) Transcript_70495:300-917(+)
MPRCLWLCSPLRRSRTLQHCGPQCRRRPGLPQRGAQPDLGRHEGSDVPLRGCHHNADRIATGKPPHGRPGAPRSLRRGCRHLGAPGTWPRAPPPAPRCGRSAYTRQGSRGTWLHARPRAPSPGRSERMRQDVPQQLLHAHHTRNRCPEARGSSVRVCPGPPWRGGHGQGGRSRSICLAAEWTSARASPRPRSCIRSGCTVWGLYG